MSTRENILDAPETQGRNWPLLAWEALAVVLGASYTILYTYGSMWCWPAALGSSVIFMYLCFRKRIYAETALHLFYFAIAIYGWLTWGTTIEEGPQSLPWQTHAISIGGGVVLCFVAAWLLRRFTNAFWPGVDTFTTVFSIIATVLMVMAIRENWYYWIVIDTVSIFLYASRRMYLTALLFVVYTILAINGAIQWN